MIDLPSGRSLATSHVLVMMATGWSADQLCVLRRRLIETAMDREYEALGMGHQSLYSERSGVMKSERRNLQRSPWLRVPCTYCTAATQHRCLVCNGDGSIIAPAAPQLVALRRRIGVLP